MPQNRPTGTVTGREGWEWNRRQAGDRTGQGTGGTHGGRPAESPDRGLGGDRGSAGRSGAAGARREVRELEAELERTERRLQCVIDRYERLLAERDRELAADGARTDRGEASLASRVAGALRGLTGRR